MFTKKMRVFSAILSVCMILSLLAGFAMPAAAEDNYDEVQSLSGLTNVSALPDIKDGLIAATNYKVTDRAGMDAIAEAVAAGESLNGYTFTMANDIDMSGDPFAGIGSTSNATASHDNNKTYLNFQGTFDGNGFVFKNLFIMHTSVYGVGIFGNVMNATIKNVGVASGLVVGAGYTGSIVGLAHGETIIENCWNAATVIGGSNSGTGGLIGGVVDGRGALINSYNLGLIFNYTNTASGLIGRLMGSSADYVLQNCYSAGTIVDGLCAFSNTSYTYFSALYAPASESAVAATDAADNYYLSSIGKPGWEKGAAIAEDVNDGAKAFKASEFATLHTKLNNNISSESAYTVEYTYSEAGFPVLTYKNGNTIVAKRLPAADAKNVAGNDWQDESELFKTFSAKAQKGLTVSSMDVGTANDLFVAAMLTAFNSAGSNFGIANISLTADIDMDDLTLADIDYYIPIGANGTVAYTFDGQGHTVKNWAAYAHMSTTYYPHGGFISDMMGGGTLTNVSLENARSVYDSLYVPNQALYGSTVYSYPGLLVERVNSKEATITDCSATGLIDIRAKDAANDNNNAGIIARVWGNLATVRNCWTETTAIHSYPATPSVYACRAIGSANTVPAAAKYENVYWFAEADLNDPNTGAADNKLIGTEIQTRMTPEEGHTEAIAVKLNNAGSALWTIKNIDGAKRLCRAADESETLVTVSVQKWIPTPAGYVTDAIPYGETTISYHMRGGEYMPADIAGYELDNEQEVPVLLDGDKTINYYMIAPDYANIGAAEELLALFNPDLYGEAGTEIFAKLEIALDELEAAKSKSESEQVAAIYGVMLHYEAANAYMQGGNMSAEYPNLPAISEYETYKNAGISDWAVKTKEDWAYAANVLDPSIAAELRLHLTNDIDMQNTNVKPLAYGQGFNGLIDGHGYSFYNFNITMIDPNNLSNTTVANELSYGLVAYLNSSGIIQNLGMASGKMDISAIGSQEQGVGAFAGVAHASSKIINCWNGMNINAVNKNSPSRVGGIVGRGYCTLYGCYNWGTVTGNNAYTHGLNAYGQNGTGKFYNCYSLPSREGNGKYAAAIGQGGSYVSNAAAPINCYQNTWSIANYLIYDTENLANKAAEEFSKAHTLTWEEYESGYLAYALNAGHFTLAGVDPVYFTVDASGETVHGTAANATRKLTVVMKIENAGSETKTMYVNGDAVVNLSEGGYAVQSANIKEGAASLLGNKLTMAGTDVSIELTVACGHSGTTVYTLNSDGTHDWTCTACGEGETGVECVKSGAWKNDAAEGEHSANCVCGRKMVADCAYKRVQEAENASVHKLYCECGDYIEEACTMAYEQINNDSHKHYCKVCGAGETAYCSYGEYVKVKAPTYTSFGKEERSCVCGRVQTANISKLSGANVMIDAPIGYAGEELTADLSLKGVSGSAKLNYKMTITYDAQFLKFKTNGFSYNGNVGGATLSTSGNTIVITITNASAVEAVFGSLKFDVLKTAPSGKALIDIAISESNSSLGANFAVVDILKYAWGDANGDKVSSIADVVLLLRVANGESDVVYNKAACDVWNDRFQSEGADNKITLADAVLILKYIMGDYQPKL